MFIENGYSYLKSLCDCKINPHIIFGACEALLKFGLITWEEHFSIMERLNFRIIELDQEEIL